MRLGARSKGPVEAKFVGGSWWSNGERQQQSGERRHEAVVEPWGSGELGHLVQGGQAVESIELCLHLQWFGLVFHLEQDDVFDGLGLGLGLRCHLSVSVDLRTGDLEFGED
nr:hypothetical protein CFP56_04913 [Quercus suber]